MTELGAVAASVCVSADGVPSDVKITKSSGNDRLDQATQKMLSGAHYRPAKDANGKPVAMCDPPCMITWKWTPPPRQTLSPHMRRPQEIINRVYRKRTALFGVAAHPHEIHAA